MLDKRIMERGDVFDPRSCLAKTTPNGLDKKSFMNHARSDGNDEDTGHGKQATRSEKLPVLI